MAIPKEKQDILIKIVVDLNAIDNITAIVLGGSYATRTASDSSDLDIGIYYSEKSPFNIEDTRLIEEKYAGSNKPTVTGFYGWGHWVNGGAWIETPNGKVDFLYRNIEQVISTIDKSKNGEWENDFDQQPPYGYSSVMYLAETRSCIPLADPTGIIQMLKSAVQIYPVKLKEKIIRQSLWSAEFTIVHAGYFLKKHDIYSTIGCLTRAVKNIITALFAINEIYPIGDKGAVEILNQSDKRPEHLPETIENILCANKNNINSSIDLLKTLFKKTVELTNGAYQSPYQFRK